MTDLLAALESARDFLMDGTPEEDISPVERRTLATINAAIAAARGAVTVSQEARS